MPTSKPWTKRWPRQWATRATFVSPLGNKLEFETPLTEKQAKAILEILAEAIKDTND